MTAKGRNSRPAGPEPLAWSGSVLTDALPRLDVGLVDGVVSDAGVLAAVTTATGRTA
jgi:hypothetical protein